MVRAVVFDVGETLVDETRLWGAVADALGVPRLTAFGVLGGLVERGRHHRELFAVLEREPVDWPPLEAGDLYPDALPCLDALRADGYRVGVAANQPEATAALLLAARARARLRRHVGGLGRREAGAGVLRQRRPGGRRSRRRRSPTSATASTTTCCRRTAPGWSSVFLRRGPWGYLHAGAPRRAEARIRIDSLAELPEALRGV